MIKAVKEDQIEQIQSTSLIDISENAENQENNSQKNNEIQVNVKSKLMKSLFHKPTSSL